MNRSSEKSSFEERKKSHIDLAVDARTQTVNLSQFDSIRFNHCALPDLNFSDLNLETLLFKKIKQPHPFYVSSMTAGHQKAPELNQRLAEAAEKNSWIFAVGSQRRELEDPLRQEWQWLEEYPKLLRASNIGISQLIEYGPQAVLKLIEALKASFLIVHLNPLQECLQPEGTTNFKNGLQSIQALVKESPIPIVVKEVGCGLSAELCEKLSSAGVAAVDLSGLGGTHWGRLEGLRSPLESLKYEAALTFSDWGLTNIETLKTIQFDRLKCDVWGSGGVRNGLDAAKLIALGCQAVGVAQPLIKAALISSEAVKKIMDQYEFELKISLFNTGSGTLSELKHSLIKQV